MCPIQIIHVSTATSWRGGEQQLAYLAGELKNHGVKQEIFCADNTPMASYCDRNGISKISFKKTGALNLKAARMLANICSKEKQVILHCHDSHAHNIAYFSSLIFRNPSPVIVHRRVDFPVSNTFFSKAKYKHPKISKYICVSNAIRELLIPSLKYPEKAMVIHSGIDLDRFANITNKNSLRKEFGFSEENILLGNVAALAPHKDYYTFIRTAEILLKNNPRFRFVIIGDGPEKASIESEIKARNLHNKVVLTGFRTNTPELLKEFNVLLLTSKTEGLGTTILDAFASEIPVVATKAGGIPEVVEHGITGLLAETGDAQSLADMVEAVLKNSDLMKNLVINAGNRVKNFDYRISAAKTLEVYKEVLNAKIKQ